MTLGERIRKVRKMLNLTQEAFASRIGTVQNTITGYENMRRNPSAQVITLICREFNVNESWLRTGEGEIFNQKSYNELDLLKEKYKLTNQEYIFLKKYFELDLNERKIIMNFIKSVNENVDSNTIDIESKEPLTVYEAVPKTPEELEALYSVEPHTHKKNGTDGE